MKWWRPFVNNSKIGRDNIQIGSNVSNVQVILSRSNYRIERIDTEANSASPGQDLLPSRMLDYQYQIVPFHGRKQELATLNAWLADSGTRTSIQLISGPGGQGKSRLAGQFASFASRAGWTVAQAVEEPFGRAVTQVDRDHPKSRRPLLLIIDYADRWPLTYLLEALSDVSLGDSTDILRVLLVARKGSQLWDSLRAELGRSIFEFAQSWRLGALDPMGQERQAAFGEAVCAFSALMGVEPSGILPPSDINDGAYGSPLILHMAALAAVCAEAENIPLPERADLSSFLLERERRYWLRTIRSSVEDRARKNISLADLERVVTVAALIGPLGRAKAVEIITMDDGMVSTRAEAETLLGFHELLYPNPIDDGNSRNDLVLTPIRPDRLAEDLLAECFKDGFTRSAVVRLAGRVEPAALARRILTILAASSARHVTVSQVLIEAIGSNPKLVKNANSQVLQALVRDASYEVLEEFFDHLPEFNLDANQGALEMSWHLLDNLPESAGKPRRAHLYHSVSYRLAMVGEREDALRHAERAVQIYQQVPGAEGLVGLARALESLCLRQGELGYHDEALSSATRAVEILDDAVNDDVSLVPRYAVALSNLAVKLARKGRNKLAVECAETAVRIQQPLVEFASADFVANYASSLSTLSARLNEVGRTVEGIEFLEQSLEIRKRLSDDDPAAYKPDYLLSLGNLATIVGVNGDHERALQLSRDSVEICRELVDVEPRLYLLRLATALMNMAAHLDGNGFRNESVEASTEAIAIIEKLRSVEPSLYWAELASAYVNRSVALTDLGEHREANRLTREAVNLLNRGRIGQPGTVSREYATALWAFARARLASGAELDDAFGAAAEAATLFVELSGRFPEKHSMDLLNVFSVVRGLAEKRGNNDIAEIISRTMGLMTGGAKQDDKPHEENEFDAPRMPPFDTQFMRGVFVAPPHIVSFESMQKYMTNPRLLTSHASETAASSMFALVGDAALGSIFEWAIEDDTDSPGMRIGDGSLSEGLPVALFEFRHSIVLPNRHGGIYEYQVEQICGKGFRRVGPGVSVIPRLSDWYVSRDRNAVRLVDGENGLWASTRQLPDERWRISAERLGCALVLFGVRLGVRRPAGFGGGEFDARTRAAHLREARRLGFVAGAMVPCRL